MPHSRGSPFFACYILEGAIQHFKYLAGFSTFLIKIYRGLSHPDDYKESTETGA